MNQFIRYISLLGIDKTLNDVEGGQGRFQCFQNRWQAKKIKQIIFILSSVSLVCFFTRAELHLLTLSLE